MNPTTSLEFSRKIYEIIGEQETEYRWLVGGKLSGETYSELMKSKERRYCTADSAFCAFTAYTFGELLRVMPLIGKEESFDVKTSLVETCAFLYAKAPTPEQGMKDVEAYLEQYL